MFSYFLHCRLWLSMGLFLLGVHIRACLDMFLVVCEHTAPWGLDVFLPVCEHAAPWGLDMFLAVCEHAGGGPGGCCVGLWCKETSEAATRSLTHRTALIERVILPKIPIERGWKTLVFNPDLVLQFVTISIH